MRTLAVVFLATLVVLYALGAVYFYSHERWARDALPDSSISAMELEHPDATLGVIRDRLERRRYDRSQLPLLERALLQAPSFYEGPFYLAAFHQDRLEEPEKVRAAYEASLERYPANGRLRLAYGIFLLQSRTTLEGWRGDSAAGVMRDPLPLAEEHLRAALALEPELAWRALEELERYRIPPSRWASLVSDDPLARRHLMDALTRGGHREEGLAFARQQVSVSDDPAVLRQIALRGLSDGAPELALEAAERWLEIAGRTSGLGSEVFRATLFVSRAERALGKEDVASETLLELLERVESRFGRTSRSSVELLCLLGNEYLRLGQTATAETLFAQAASRRPSYVPAVLGLARSYSRAGELEAAIGQYEEVLRLDAEHDPAKRELRNLLARTSR